MKHTNTVTILFNIPNENSIQFYKKHYPMYFGVKKEMNVQIILKDRIRKKKT